MSASVTGAIFDVISESMSAGALVPRFRFVRDQTLAYDIVDGCPARLV
jgi:hypothetical protein